MAHCSGGLDQPAKGLAGAGGAFWMGVRGRLGSDLVWSLTCSRDLYKPEAEEATTPVNSLTVADGSCPVTSLSAHLVAVVCVVITHPRNTSPRAGGLPELQRHLRPAERGSRGGRGARPTLRSGAGARGTPPPPPSPPLCPARPPPPPPRCLLRAAAAPLHLRQPFQQAPRALFLPDVKEEQRRGDTEENHQGRDSGGPQRGPDRPPLTSPASGRRRS